MTETFVFIANSYIGKGISGGDRIFIELARRSSRGRLIIIGWDDTKKLIAKYKIDCEFININMPLSLSRFFISSYIFRSIYGLFAISKILRDINDRVFLYSSSDFWPDVIPAFYAKFSFEKVQWSAAFFLAAPSYFDKSDVYKGQGKIKLFFYKTSQFLSKLLIGRYADRLVSCSSITLEILKKSIPKNRQHIPSYMIFGGVNINHSKSQRLGVFLRSRKIYDVCFMARFHPQKGPDEMVQIWKIVHKIDPTLKLAMIGNGPLEKDVKSLINKFGLNNSVSLLGFLDGAEKEKVFLSSRIFAHPVVYDTGGMAAIEAMSLGLPAIAYDHIGLREVYPYGMKKIKVFDRVLFARSIIEMLKNKQIYTKISNEAVDYSEDWNWDIKAKEFYEFIT